MEWGCRKPKARFRQKHTWHKWFAWRPVRVPTIGKRSGMKKVWLKVIDRKGYFYGDMVSSKWTWFYR